MNIKDKNSGFTLIEVVLVIVIIGILSTVAIKSLTVTV
ncbi:MAG: prepilin-type N-terminal cleavage/methylation domain-containing protein, partial [candidate division Zixibacteria bacterium]|nr:prepilin-type N-terminal cleavage/methylation domain-containing protein [candidate division Zixibacteria bacterium]